MPEVSRFLGIVVRMNYNDHVPAHFHARYGKSKAVIGIESNEVLAGSLPKRIRGLVRQWASIHRQELLENWTRSEQNLPLKRIEPLE